MGTRCPSQACFAAPLAQFADSHLGTVTVPLSSTHSQLLAPARAGKSSLLKVLAGRVPSNRFEGSVWYGGQPAKAVNVNRLVAFVGQSDVHLPLLTVRMFGCTM